ncbi:NUDIX domain-containing protein, partial [Pseudomonas viridiflava]|uniref:NUDIX domain-containing protein n=1 Tax=Pseudomonas viridiflava TaxID=33069 RepID=UPI003D6634B6
RKLAKLESMTVLTDGAEAPLSATALVGDMEVLVPMAGLIDKDEQPEEVAHREAEEEAGLTFSALWPITKYFPSPGGSTEYVHLYLGRCDSSGAGGRCVRAAHREWPSGCGRCRGDRPAAHRPGPA